MLADAILHDAPTGYWPLAGNNKDAVAGRDATGGVAPTYSGGALDGYGAAFNGSTQSIYTNLSAALLFNSVGTMECWFKTTLTTFATFFVVRDNSGLGGGSGPSFIVNRTTSGDVCCLWPDSSGASQQTVVNGSYNDGKWHQLVWVCPSAGGTKTLYVDGVAKGTSTANRANGSASSMRASIGANWNGSAGFQFFTGSLAHAALWIGTALTADQVAKHYEAYLRTGVVVG